MNNKVPDLIIKLLIVGNSSVGKSCILSRYCNDIFNNTFISTIGIDFNIKRIKVNNKNIKLQLWDTAGQERFKSITVGYFRGSQGALVVYDVSDRKSFENVVNWIKDLKEHGNKSMDLFLIANKIDLDRVVSTEEGKNLAKNYNIPYFECSAKSGDNIDNIFESISIIISQKIIKISDSNKTIVLQKEEKKHTEQKVNKISKCCNI